MKKIILIIIALILIVVIGLAAFIYLNADSLLARLKPELERVASDALGTRVQLGDLHLGIGLKPAVSIDGVTLGEKSSSQSLSVKKIVLSLDLMPLLSKELKVTDLTIIDPQITAIKSAAGVRIAGMPEKKEASPAPEQAAKKEPSSGQIAPPQLPVAFALEKFTLSNGEITLEDQTRTDPLARIEVRNLDVQSSLSIAGTMLKLKNASVSTTINKVLPVQVAVPSISIDANSFEAILEKIVVKFLESDLVIDGSLNGTSNKGAIAITSSGIQLTKLSALSDLIPALKLFPLDGSVQPNLKLELDPEKLAALTGKIGVNGVGTTVNNFKIANIQGGIQVNAIPLEQRASAQELGLSFQGAPMKLDFDALLKDMKASVESFKLSAFSGSISGNASTTLTAPQQFNTNINVLGLDISQALGALSGTGESALSGVVENVSVSLNGQLGPQLKETTGGKITFKIRDTLVKQINIAHEAFKGLLTLPVVGERIGRSIPAQFRDELLSKDTKIRSISGVLNGSNGTFNLSNLVLLGSFFSVQGSGTVTLNGDVKLLTKIAFNKEFSASLVAQIKELRSIPDQNGEIVFPLSISGRAPNFSVVPDTEGFLKLGAQAAIKEGAQHLLDRALKGRGGKGTGLEGLLGF